MTEQLKAALLQATNARLTLQQANSAADPVASLILLPLIGDLHKACVAIGALCDAIEGHQE
jgi:hypothetical protein